MTIPAFSVRVTPHGERLAKALNKQHAGFVAYYEKAIRILSSAPYNRTGRNQIKGLNILALGNGPGPNRAYNVVML